MDLKKNVFFLKIKLNFKVMCFCKFLLLLMFENANLVILKTRPATVFRGRMDTTRVSALESPMSEASQEFFWLLS